MAKFAVILPAAGKSSRFSGPAGRKKVFLELAGRPVWVRSAEPFTNRQDVVQTIVVVNPDDLEWFQDKFRPNLAFMNIDIVTGGNERADSVGNALKKVTPKPISSPSTTQPDLSLQISGSIKFSPPPRNMGPHYQPPV